MWLQSQAINQHGFIEKAWEAFEKTGQINIYTEIPDPGFSFCDKNVMKS